MKVEEPAHLLPDSRAPAEAKQEHSTRSLAVPANTVAVALPKSLKGKEKAAAAEVIEISSDESKSESAPVVKAKDPGPVLSSPRKRRAAVKKHESNQLTSDSDTNSKVKDESPFTSGSVPLSARKRRPAVKKLEDGFMPPDDDTLGVSVAARPGRPTTSSRHRHDSSVKPEDAVHERQANE
ncbi:hypothetical protein BDV98DRAFT_85828 [Pterulicium gracile]|uniref:Uncharacterized protein n=1 Tax=Pterulicium gracile TaxID=1884261 RepID=A0A5C3QFX7_9AGAR|nr:hypothetical protein BDV98DRAFT_85828 [Pterula gracilis]